MSTIKLKKAKEGTIEPVKAERVVENKPTVKSRKKLLDPAIIKEDESKKTVNSRHYVLNNNTKKSYFSANNINYFDKKEKAWKDVDNSLIESGNRFVGKLGNYSAEIYKPETKKGIKIFKDDAMVSWVFMGKGDNAVVLDVKKEEGEFEGTSASSVVYKNISNDVDLEYKLQGNNVKENIIVHKKSNEYKYDFALDTTGYEVRLSENGDKIEFYLNNEKEFYIPAPFMYDAAGLRSGDVYYELEEKEKCKYVFSVIASEEWINDGNRTLPVTIDPQLVFGENNIFSYSFEMDELSFGGGNWVETIDYNPETIIALSDANIARRTKVIIDRSQVNFEDDRIIKATITLFLKSHSYAGNDIKIAGNTGPYYNQHIKADITHIIKNSKSENPYFYIELTDPYINSDYEFYMTGEYAPTLEVEYITDEKSRHETKKIDLVGGVTGEIELNSGRLVIDFNEVLPEDSVMGIGISHTYKEGGNEMGEPVPEYYGFNLNEKLEKFGDIDGQYVYTDGHGNKHLFREYFYKLNNYGKKEYLEVSKSDISVDTEGTLTYNGEEVFVEYKSATGLKASTKVEGYAGIEFYDDRSDEIKQLEEQKETYAQTLLKYVKATDTGIIRNQCFSSELAKVEYNSFITNLTGGEMVLTRDETLNLKNLALQVLSSQHQESSYDLQQNSLQLQIDSIEKNGEDGYQIVALDNQIKALESQKNMASLNYNNYDNILRQDSLLPTGSDEKMKEVERVYYVGLKEEYNKQIANFIDQINNLDAQKTALENQKSNLSSQKENIGLLKQDTTNQKSIIGAQKDLIISRREEYLTQFKKLVKEYFRVKEELDLKTRTLPVNYLSNGKIVKGYAKDGKLVAVYDKYEHYAIFEYNKLKKDQLDRIYDDQGKEVKFEYNASGNLISITNAKGRKVECSSYNNVVTHLKYDDGREIELYFAIGMINIDDSKSGKGVELSFEGNRLCNIIRYSLATAIEHGVHQEKMWDYANAVTTRINYGVVNSDYYLEIVNENVKERYLSNGEETLIGYQKEVDGKVVTAERYEYVPYYIGTEKQSDPRSVVVKADKSCLYVNNLENFIFVDGDSEKTTFNCFNNVEKKETSPILLTDSNAMEQNSLTTTVKYIYDSEQRVTEEKTTESYSYSGDIVITYKKYYYNNKGDLVRVESYTDGEELTKGKYIEETVYDDQGRVVKSFTYNSLDSSSKFYTQSEYNEEGQVVAEYDETGEHKTEFELCENDEVVLTEKLPNGSKLSYGHDIVDGATSISQSTEDGESNNTNKRYTYGQVTELVSGNTKVNYTYDSKRRITKVGMNGNPNYIEYAYAEGIVFDEGLFDEVITKNAKNEMVTRYTDKNGKIRQMVKGGVTVKYTYDEKMRLKTITDSSTSETETRTYDDLNRVVGVTRGAHSESYNYGPFGKLNSKTVGGKQYNYLYSNIRQEKLTGLTIQFLEEEYQYDCLDRSKKINQIFNSIAYGKQFGYQKVGDHTTNRINSIAYLKNGVTDGKINYTYDSMGNITSISENGKQKTKYEYDLLGRIIKEIAIDNNKEILYTYDVNGNILTKTIDGEIVEYKYKENSDQLVSFGEETFVYDAIGNPTTFRGMTAEWENGRRLKSLSDGTNTVTYTYDGLGKRRTKTSGGVTTIYTYDSNGTLIKEVGEKTIEYFYGKEGVIGITINGAQYLFRKNVFGDVTHIYDSNGTLVGKYSYSAFGECTVEIDINNVASDNPIRYRGYYYDSETSLYYLNTRYYDPELCRFVTIDSIEYINPETINGLNLYAYCGNNPVANVDPNGNAWWHWLLGAVVVVAVAALTVVTAGAAAVALGATAATVNAVMVGAAVGGLVAGGTNLVMQGVTTNWQTVDYRTIALSTFVGGASGAISAGFGQLSTGVVAGTRLLAHKGFQTAVNVMLSSVGYIFSSAISGEEVTLDGLIFASFGGFVSGVTFNWGTVPALGLMIGLEFTGYTRDIIDYIRNSFKNAQRVN